VIVPPGEFDMGEGSGRKRVRIDHNFALAARDVTVAEFRRFCEDHQYFKDHAPAEDCPVNAVSWYDAAAYCNWLSKQEGIGQDQWCYLPNEDGGYAAGMKMAADWQRSGYRLPTQAEWEYACRAGSVTPWAMGTAEVLLPKYAWLDGNSYSRSHPVGSLRPNELGLFDMHGNVWQWCQDMRGHKDSMGYEVDDKSRHPFHGGAFNLPAWYVRSANHIWTAPASRIENLGFRPARTFR
jgi:formylglycine-generating enzyme required for sulfatase activity